MKLNLWTTTLIRTAAVATHKDDLIAIDESTAIVQSSLQNAKAGTISLLEHILLALLGAFVPILAGVPTRGIHQI
jgi:hypothetical protein